MTDVRTELPRWSNRTVECLMAALLIAGPVTFGALDAWAQTIVLGLIAAMVVVTLAGAWTSRGFRVVRTWTFLPILLVLLIGAVQLLPLPRGILNQLQPGLNDLRQQAETFAGVDSSASVPPSAYPLATERQLRLLLGGAALFFVVLQFYTGDRARQRRLLRSILLVGLGMATLVLGQYAADAQTILGLVARSHPYSGTFANHSHLGQFINLSIGAAAALLVGELRRLRAEGLTWTGVRDVVLSERRHWDLIAAGALIVLGPVAVLVSLTRGGVLSFCAGAAVAATLLALTLPRRARTRHVARAGGVADLPLLGLLVGAIAMLMIVAAGFNMAYDRMASLRHLEHSSGGRLEIIRDALHVWRSSPYIGTGLGTHAFVFPAFDRSEIGNWASHAENEYVQLLEEVGAIGLASALGFLALVFAALCRSTMSLRRAIQTGEFIGRRSDLGTPGLALGLIAVAVHSGSDFGQHVPAIAFLSAILCALAIGTAERPAPPATADATIGRASRERALLSLVTVVTTVAIAWSVPGLLRDRRAESYFWQASIQRGLLDRLGWPIDHPAYRELLLNATAARDLQPRDVEYVFWLNAWRYEAITQQAEPGSGKLDPQLADWATTMTRELLDTTRECPTFGRPMAFAGQLIEQLPDRVNFTAASSRSLAIYGAELAPYDPLACFAAGRFAATDPAAHARARRLLTRAVSNGWPREQLIDVLVRDMQDIDTAIQLAGGDLKGIDRLIGLLDPMMTMSAERDALRARRDAEMVRISQDPSSSPALLDQVAQRYLASDRPAQAVDAWLRAAASDYANTGRRVRLADAMAEIGRLEEALDQLTIASRFRPGDEGLLRRIETLRSDIRARDRQRR